MSTEVGNTNNTDATNNTAETDSANADGTNTIDAYTCTELYIETHSENASINHTDIDILEANYNMHARHMTHEEQQYDEPTVQDKEIVEEMNATNMEHNSEINNKEGN